MGGGILQLSLYGSQDVVLTGNPSVTFFKSVHKRYTMFSSESIQQAFQGTPDFGRRCTCPISRQGDLVTTIWLQVDLPDLSLFQYEAAQTPTATIPAILSARYTSSTTAVVRVIPNTDGSAAKYVATVTNTDTDETSTVVGEAGATSITLTGLTTDVTYNVTVKRRTSEDVDGDPSAAMDIVSVRWCNSIGHALIRSVEYELGGARIDRHVSEYLDILAELTMPEEKRAGFNTMIGKYESWDLYDNSFQGPRTLFIPMQFAFNKAPGLSLPLVSLQFHELKLNFDFREYVELIKSNVNISSLLNERGTTPTMDCTLWSTFIFLDTPERRRYSTMPHEYLLEQCQFLGAVPIIVDAEEPTLTRKINLNFSHPVKEIMWVYNSTNTYNSGLSPSQYPVSGNDYFNYELASPLAGEDPFTTAKLQINGQDRFTQRPASFFRLCIPYMHHTRVPTKRVFSYSFSLSPEDLTQPSGSCNYSRADTSHLVLALNDSMTSGTHNGRVLVFGTSFNVLRVAAGMAGLVFVSG